MRKDTLSGNPAYLSPDKDAATEAEESGQESSEDVGVDVVGCCAGASKKCDEKGEQKVRSWAAAGVSGLAVHPGGRVVAHIISRSFALLVCMIYRKCTL